MSGLTKNDKHFAISIGINDYHSDSILFETLLAAEQDANDFIQWLYHQEGGNLPKRNIKSVIASACNLKDHLSEEQVVKKIQKHIDSNLLKIINAARRLKDNGDGRPIRLYFYFSGHGAMQQEKVRLALPGFSDKFRRCFLDFDDYYQLLTQYQVFDEIVFILDCCLTECKYIDRALQTSTLLPSPPFNSTGQQLPQTLFVYAVNKNASQKKAYEKSCPRRKHCNGLMTRALIGALTGGAAVGRPEGGATPGPLGDFVRRNTQSLHRLFFSNKTDKHTQTPQVINEMGNAVFGTFKPLVDFDLYFPQGNAVGKIAVIYNANHKEIFSQKIPEERVLSFQEQPVGYYAVSLQGDSGTSQPFPFEPIPHIDPDRKHCVEFSSGESNGHG